MNFQKKILVIEDDKLLGFTIQSVLKVHNYDVLVTDNGASGIQKAFEYNPDLILCDIAMDIVDGYQVYRVLEESSILNRIPFIFLTGSSELEDIRYGMSLGADDYLVKPIVNTDLIRSIEKRLEKFSTIREEARMGFNQLFNLSPVGIFLFDGMTVLRSNQSFSKLINLQADAAGMQIDRVFDQSSVIRIAEKLKSAQTERSELFNDSVSILGLEDENNKHQLVVSEYEKYSDYKIYIGILSPVNQFSAENSGPQYAGEIYNLLKRENIKISEALGEKITSIFKQKSLNPNIQRNIFFTRRENEILCLSMEGLPIKVIAGRLGISDRTVEKHRTRLMEKAGANNMIEVIVFALKNSLIEI